MDKLKKSKELEEHWESKKKLINSYSMLCSENAFLELIRGEELTADNIKYAIEKYTEYRDILTSLEFDLKVGQEVCEFCKRKYFQCECVEDVPPF